VVDFVLCGHTMSCYVIFCVCQFANSIITCYLTLAFILSLPVAHCNAAEDRNVFHSIDRLLIINVTFALRRINMLLKLTSS